MSKQKAMVEVVRTGCMELVGPQVGFEDRRGKCQRSAQAGKLVLAERRLEKTFGKEAKD